MYYAFKNEDGDLFTEDEARDMYHEYLDEAYDGPLTDTYGAARILEAVDPIAYRVGFNDYTSDWEEVSFEDEEAFLLAMQESDD